MADRKKRILIVDDEEPLAKALRYKFVKSGFEALAVYSGDDALAVLRREKFDVIVLDLMMPQKDGFTILRELKQRGCTTPVIIASNLGQDKDIREAKALGAIEYIVKSDTPIMNVVQVVAQLLNNPSKSK